MKYFVVCARDAAADAFGLPQCQVSKAAAIRSFTDEVNRAAEGNMLYAHPNDFELFCLGTYDTDRAQFVLSDFPESLVRAADVKKE